MQENFISSIYSEKLISDDSRNKKYNKVENLRNRLFLYPKVMSVDCFSNSKKLYSSQVDSINGLNNYADSLLSNISNVDNKSREWVSGFKEILMKDSFFENSIKNCKTINENEQIKFERNDLSHLNSLIPKMDLFQRNKLKQSFIPKSDEDQNFNKRIHSNFYDVSSKISKRDDTNSFLHNQHQSFELNPFNKRYKSSEGSYMPCGTDNSMNVNTNKFNKYEKENIANIEMEENIPEIDNYKSNQKQTGFGAFKTARDKLNADIKKKNRQSNMNSDSTSNRALYDHLPYGKSKKCLGSSRRRINSKFVPPVMNRDTDDEDSKKLSAPTILPECEDPKLQNIDPKMVELISNEIIDHGAPIDWEDIAGLEFAKKTIKEIVVWPMLRPDIFVGLRGPPKGLLLFGPPGTGKTLIGKCIANQSKSTFFNISASSLTSKWVGDGEKMVRALFAVARVHQPAVVFIDEIDSLLSQRSDHEHESSRRIKTEFLVQLDGANTLENDRLLVVGATNRPQEIDEAARRRFVKRLYIPLPEFEARKHIIQHLLLKQNHCLLEEDVNQICNKTEGYSGSDMANLCREAALGPIRRLDVCDIESITLTQVQPINSEDFYDAVKQVKASVSTKDLDLYIEWNSKFGSWSL